MTMIVVPWKRFVAAFILVAACSLALGMLHFFFMPLVDPVIAPLIAFGAFVTFDRANSRQLAHIRELIATIQNAAHSSATELQELRKELLRLNEPKETKAAGFQMPSE